MLVQQEELEVSPQEIFVSQSVNFEATFNKGNESSQSLQRQQRPNPMESFIAGSTSGAISCLLFQPLDLVKTKLQASPSTSSTTKKLLDGARTGSVELPTIKSRTISGTIALVIRQDSVLGLWRGLTPSLYRTVPGVGMYFCTLHTMKSFYKSEPTFYENLMLGFSSRATVATVVLPFTVVKARIESGRYPYGTVSQGLRTIWQTEGARGLFSGCTATILRDAPYSGVYLMFYSQGKKLCKEFSGIEKSSPVHFLCGLNAGLLASIITHPADVVKTQMQLYPSKYNGTRHCIAVVHAEHGISGFFRGLTPRCLRRTLISALSWTVFEGIMKRLKLKI